MVPPSLVRRSSIIIQRPSRQELLVAPAGIVEQRHALRQPSLFAADGLRIVAAGDANLQRVGQLDAYPEQVCGALVDFGVPLVPENVAPLRIQEDQSLGQDVNRLPQPHFCTLGLLLGDAQGACGAGRAKPRGQPAEQALQPASTVAVTLPRQPSHACPTLFQLARW